MDFSQLQKRALEIRSRYTELETTKYGRQWTSEELALGFVGDVGDLAKLVVAKNGAREIEHTDEKLRHELADCLWCVMVLANEFGIDMETEFLKTMDGLEKRIAGELANS